MLKIYRYITLSIYALIAILMVNLFFSSLINPIQTDFWLVQFGIPILIIEFISMILAIVVEDYIRYRSIIGWPIVAIVFIVASSVFFVNISPYLPIYLLISGFIKFILFNQLDEKENENTGGVLIFFILLIFSTMLAILPAFLLKQTYLEQYGIIKEYIDALLPGTVETVGKLEYVSAGLYSFSGIIYFLTTLVYSLYYALMNYRK